MMQQQQQAQQAAQKPGTPLPRPPTSSAGGRSSAPGTPGGNAPSPASGPARNASTSGGGVGAASSTTARAGVSSPSLSSSTGVGPASNVMGTPSTLVTGAGVIPTTLNVPAAVPEAYPNARGPRPTLNQGLGTAPLLGTPAILQRPEPGAQWEGLLGVQRTEGAGAGAGAAARAEFASPEFWDALTGRGTGAASLNGGAGASTSAGGGSGAAGGGVAEGAGNGADRRLLTKRKVQELVGELDGTERLDGDVEDVSPLSLSLSFSFIVLTPLPCTAAATARNSRRVHRKHHCLCLSAGQASQGRSRRGTRRTALPRA